MAGVKNLTNAIFKNLLGQLNAFTHIPVVSYNIANNIKGLKKIKNRKKCFYLWEQDSTAENKSQWHSTALSINQTLMEILYYPAVALVQYSKLLDSLIVEY